MHDLENPPIADKDVEPSSGERLDPVRVLVADDDDATRTAIAEWLTGEGCEVTGVASGSEALEALARAADGRDPPPDVVILDFVMPGFSGLGILGVMRRFPSMPPAIVVTAFPDSSVETAARRLGAARVLRKPVDLDALTALVREHAGR